MSETSSVTVRVDSEDKRRAEQLFSSLGLNMSTAFNMFIKQTILCDGMPFQITLHHENDNYFCSKTNSEPFDYTEWRKVKFNDMSLEELNKAAAEYSAKLHSEDNVQ